MNNKYKIIGVGSLIILLLITSLIFFIMPSININLNGKKNLTINVGEDYVDAGATAYLQKLFHTNLLSLEVINNVDIQKPGKYIVTYKANYHNLKKEVIRVVNVVDAVPPVLTLNQQVKICNKNNLIEVDAKAIDNYDGDISDKITYKIQDSRIKISVQDSSNNKSEIIKELMYIDDEKPHITLNGDDTIYINVGEEYIEQGATAYDSCDGDLTSKINQTGKVDFNQIGTYQIIYNVTDNNGNESSITRNVIVEGIDQTIKNGIIYLTFDDGPCQYTDQILDILAKYNVKATFFVTNQFPKYQYDIKREYDEGHTVGIHTYSHKWSVYDSVDAYLNDFNKIQDIIIEQTEFAPKYFRFPGGSSNTVSRSHSKGIMTKLTKLMTEKGYVYFDWTFDSGDTSRKNNSKEAILKNVKNNLKGTGSYIILMHDIKKNTLDALPQIIEYAKAEGYIFKAIDDKTPIAHFRVAN